MYVSVRMFCVFIIIIIIIIIVIIVVIVVVNILLLQASDSHGAAFCSMGLLARESRSWQRYN